MKKYNQKVYKNPALDLFGEVPVTVDEVVAWCETVAGIAPESPRFPYYVRAWHVVEKIRAWKLTGQPWPEKKGPENSGPLRLAAVLSVCGA